jgi:hypothetical protein
MAEFIDADLIDISRKARFEQAILHIPQELLEIFNGNSTTLFRIKAVLRTGLRADSRSVFCLFILNKLTVVAAKT